MGAGIVLLTALSGVALGEEAEMARKVKLPQRLMTATEVLQEVYLQAGVSYAYPTGALARQIDATPFGGEATVAAVLKPLAESVTVRGSRALLEAALDDARLADLTRRLSDADADVRRVAAYELGCSKSTRAIEPLFAALTDKDESVRHHVLRSLNRLERDFSAYHPAGRVSIFDRAREGAVPDILSVLKNAPDPTTNEWIWAAELMTVMPCSWGTEEFKKAAEHPYIRTRLVARAALAHATKEESARPPASPDDRRDTVSAARLIAGLTSVTERRLVPSIRALALRNDVGPETLLSRFKYEEDAEVRAELLLALGRKGGKDAWDAILKEVGNENPLVRRSAIMALDRCPDPRAIEPLMAVLVGNEFSIDDKNAATVALGMIATPAVVKRVSDYCSETMNQNRAPITNAAQVLEWCADPSSVPVLARMAALKREGEPGYAWSVKGYTYLALGRIGTKPAVESLMQHYDDWDNTARFCGHSAIRLAHNQEAVDHYVERVKVGRGRIAPHGLEEAEDPRAVDALAAALPTATDDRLHFAIQALGRIGDPKGVPALIAALDRKEPWAAHEALRALRWRWFWSRPDVQAAVKRHPIFKTFLTPPPSLDEQPENTWVCRLWPIDFDDYRACNTTYEAGLAFDEGAGRVVKWGSHGQRCDSPQSGETWLYDPATNTWKESASALEPFGMCGTWGLAYDKAEQSIVSVQEMGADHGWQWDRARSLRVSVPWVYRGAQDQWTPVRPVKNPGQRGFHTMPYLDAAQVVMLYGGQGGDKATAGNVWIYDTYANTWTTLPLSDPMPGARAHTPLVYLPTLDRVLTTSGGGRGAGSRTWLFDLASNSWKDAQATGNPPSFRPPVRFDPVSGTALGFLISSDRAATVWQYDPKANVWQRLPPAPEPTPHYESVDMVYDPVHNVFILDGGHINWNTDHIGCREVWTYRFKKPVNPSPAARGGDAPTGVAVHTRGGTCTVSWKPVAGAVGYVVYRGAGDAPWTVKYAKATPAPLTATSFADSASLPPSAGEGEGGGARVVFYYVCAVDEKGQEGPASLKVRAQPRIPEGVVVSVLPDRTVLVEWAKAAAPDVVGYHVYAATFKVGDRMHPSSLANIGEFKRLTEKPITSTTFADARRLAEATGLFNHEVRGYQVRAVNALGVESGPSAMGLTLTSSVPRDRVVEQPDGTTLITWEAVPEKAIRGYAVYRMDGYRPSFAVRLNAQPVTGTSYVDRPETPRSERRRYYVVAVDALGEEGLPSSGAYSFGRP
jgi:HEAT repeat protein